MFYLTDIFSILITKQKNKTRQTFATIRVYGLSAEAKLCNVRHLNEYISRTSTLRKEGIKQILLRFIKSHNPVSTDTISRWVKQQLFSAGVDISKFKAHSVGLHHPQHLAKLNVNIEDIIKSVGWSNEKTFQKYYNKPVEQTFNFRKTLLPSLCDAQE